MGMGQLAPSDIFLFEDFRLDRRGGLFQRDQRGAIVPVAIGSRGLDILGVLVERAGEVVSKDQITAAVWPGIAVDDSNLTVQISALRRVLDNGRSNGSCIQTVAGRGYRFVAAVTHPVAEAPSVPMNGGAERAEEGTPELVADLPASSASIAASSCRRTAGIAIAAAVGVVLAITVGVWRLWSPSKPPPTTAAAVAASTERRLVAPRMSIVVLPFANLGNDPDQQYFIDALTDDLTIDLSRLNELFVIARNSAFAYGDKPVDTKQIGRALGVRYVLEGSVQRSGNQFRVNAQLIDAETGAYLWAEPFDRDASNMFAVQNEITTRIAIALDLALIVAEAARPKQNPDALDYVLRGLAALNKPPTRGNYAEAMSAFERALALDPSSIDARSWVATLLADRILDFPSDASEGDIQRADMLAKQALAAAPRRALPHYAKAEVLRTQRRCREAIPEYETVLALNRTATGALSHIGRCKIYVGPIEEAISILERAIRLNPRGPYVGNQYYRVGEAHLLQSHLDEAIAWLEKGRNADPELGHIHAFLSAAYALKGEAQLAAAELAEARKLSAAGSWSSIARLRAGTRYETPGIRALAEATYYTGLRKAGMPEE
jgi:adenylate cyclase